MEGSVVRAVIVVLALMASVAAGYAAEPLRIVAAENFYGDLATQIGGSHVAVTSILSNPDSDPHLFEASAETARALADAEVVIYNGADYDPWMDRLLSASGNASRSAIVAGDLMGTKPGDNPHLWYDLRTFPAVAVAFARELARRDPADAAEFAANLQKFDAAFAAATAGVATIRASHAGTKVTATEPVVGYLAAAMGLEMLNESFQLAAMNDTEPSARDVADFEDSLTSRTAKILFYNSQVTDDTSARMLDIARQSGVPVVGGTETEPAGTTIETWFAGQIAAIAAALGPKP